MKKRSVADGGMTTRQIDMLTRDLYTGMRAIHPLGVALRMVEKRLHACGLDDAEIDGALSYVYGTAWKLRIAEGT